MSLCDAVKEMVEAVLLFMEAQCCHLSPSSAKQLKPGARVGIVCPVEPTGTGVEITWQVRVEARGLGAYYLDGTTFLNTLCQFGEELRRVVLVQERRELLIYSCRIGEFSMVQCHSASLPPNWCPSTSLPVEETVLGRPQDFPPSGLRICFEVKGTLQNALSEAHRLLSHLHLLHLINPEVELEFSVKVSHQTLITRNFPREPSRPPLSSSSYRIVTSLHHFLPQPTRRNKLKLVRGSSYTLPPLAKKNGTSSPLRVYCTAAVLPHISLRKGKKIPANKTCQHLHLCVFGPGSIPLLGAGSPVSLPLASLADWESYGLSLGPKVVQQELNLSGKSSGVVVPSYQCQLSGSRQARGDHRRVSRVNRQHTLLLFLFLEEDGAHGRGRGSCPNEQWRKQMELVHTMRGRLEGTLYSFQRKFHQAVHSTLNKLLCNYGTHLKTVSVMHTAFPLVADAVSSIIKSSKNHHFQEECMDILKVNLVAALKVQTDEDVQDCVKKRLWEIVEKTLHISESQTIFPHEPTSPELMEAASDCNPTITEQTLSTVVSKYQNTNSTPSTTSTATTGELFTPLNSKSSLTPKAFHQGSRSGESSASIRPQSSSLFQALIYSRKATQCRDSIHPSGTNQTLTQTSEERASPATNSKGDVDTSGVLPPKQGRENSLHISEDEDSVSFLGPSLAARSSSFPTYGAARPTSPSQRVSGNRFEETSCFEELEGVSMEDSPDLSLSSGAQTVICPNCDLLSITSDRQQREGENDNTQGVWSDIEDDGFEVLEKISNFSTPSEGTSDFDTVCISSDCEDEEWEEVREEESYLLMDQPKEAQEAEEEEGEGEEEEEEEEGEKWWDTELDTAIAQPTNFITTKEANIHHQPHEAQCHTTRNIRGLEECSSDEEWTAAMETNIKTTAPTSYTSTSSPQCPTAAPQGSTSTPYSSTLTSHCYSNTAAPEPQRPSTDSILPYTVYGTTDITESQFHSNREMLTSCTYSPGDLDESTSDHEWLLMKEAASQEGCAKNPSPDYSIPPYFTEAVVPDATGSFTSDGDLNIGDFQWD